MNIAQELITKEAAEQILSKQNGANRPKNVNHISFLAAQMTEGTWRDAAGDPIRFSASGRLLDGQHRLAAVVQSGIAQHFVVIRDVPDDVFDVLDTGMARTSGHMASIAGHSHANMKAALARKILLYRNGHDGGVRISCISNHSILLLLQQEDLSEYVLFAIKRYSESRMITMTEYAFFYYIFSKKSESDASDFLVSLASATNIVPGSAVHILRKKLEQSVTNSYKMSKNAKHFYIIRAWNAFRRGEFITKLQFDPAAKMPTPV